jgi:CheY-like chemotaxis protein
MTEAPLVLIVDDDPDMLELVDDALRARGYRTETAWNGEEALTRVSEHEPRLILLDMRMPIMDGWTFARILRERYGRRIPVVVVTAAEDSKLRAAESGAIADLGKPFELSRLYDVVADTVGVP